MKWFLVIWVEFKMPGGWLAGQFVPEHLRPVLGQAIPKYAIFTHKQCAVKRIQSLPPMSGPRLFWFDGLKAWEKDVTYETTVTVEGAE